MSKLTDRVSYLKGLCEGMKLNMDKDSNKLIAQILDVLGDITAEMEDMDEAQDELNEYVESIDDDLADLEDVLFGDEDDEDDDCDCGCGDDCDCCDDEDDEDEDEEDEDGEEELISYNCPACGHEIVFKASSVDFDEDYRCPACGKPVFPEIAEDEEEIEDTDLPEDDE